MANSGANTNRLVDGDGDFTLGVNSLLVPDRLVKGQFSWGINVMTRSGQIRTRDGYASLLSISSGTAQGITLFIPTAGNPTLVFAVSGKIYISQYPFVDCSQLAGIQFSPYVDHIVFKEATQAKDLTGLVEPRQVLIMQDGRGRAAFWDGQEARHLDPNPQGPAETKIGLWMEWIGNRLWVAYGREIFASDIYDPLHFTENIYLTGGGSLQAIDGAVITGLKRTSDSKQLLAFTEGNTTSIRAGVTTRSEWANITDFVSLLFPGIGCVAGKSPVNVAGELWWMSATGARRFNAVGESIHDSKNPIASREMERSQLNLSPIRSRICGFAHSFYGGFSVPSGDVWNRHSWVFDTSSADYNIQKYPVSWQGVWMGTRPVEWVTAVIYGTERAFYISQDRDRPRIWEAFLPDQTDNGYDIECSVETRGNNYGGAQAFKRYLYTEEYFEGLLGSVHLTTDYRTEYTCWKNLMDITLCAKECELVSCDNLVMTALKPQARHVKTAEANRDCTDESGSKVTTEIGTFIQNRIRWKGKLALDAYKTWANQYQESSVGACDEGDVDCPMLKCCDPEPDYISLANDTPCDYYYAYSGGDTQLTV